MNPLDWSLIAGPLPVILPVSALLALAWLVAGRRAPGYGSLWRGMRGGRADGAVSVRWLAICVPLIVMAAGGVIASLTLLVNNVWRPFPDLLPFTIVLWSWVALVGILLALARQALVRTWPRRAAAIAAGVLVLVAAANQVNGYFQAYPSLRVALAPWLDPKPALTRTVHVTEVVASTKEQPQSRLGLVFDKVVLRDKKELPFQYPAAVVALGPPIIWSQVATTRMQDMPVQMEKGVDTGGAAVGALVANPNLAGANMRSTGRGALSAGNRGVIGIKGLALETKSSEESVIVSVKGDVKLTMETQMVIRVTDPPKH